MKKFIYTLIGVVITSFSFSQAHYTFIDFKDVTKPAVQSEFSYSEATVNKAIDDKLGKMGYKSKDVKGYAMYKSVMLPEFGGRPYDLYFRVDKKSKKDKDDAVVSMLISTGNENFISDSSSTEVINNAKRFLDNLMPSIAAYDLQQQINSQDDVVRKSEKKYTSLQNEADDLQKRKKKLEQQIEDNQKAQKDQLDEIERQKQLLDAIKARQK